MPIAETMERKDMQILVINPGSTSTKIAVFENRKQSFVTNIKHKTEELAPFDKITDQFHFRKDTILKALKDAGVKVENINCVVGRGGLVKPIPSGVYKVTAELMKDLKIGILGEHASNLGGLIANDIAASLENVPAFIADPVVVDEMQNVARISGHPEFERLSIFHALNQKAIARLYAEESKKKYEKLNLIVAHLGGGVSVGAHCRGKVIDVNQALDGEGPFSPERSGTLPAGALAKLCFSGKYSYPEIKKMITGKGGFVAHLGTNDAYDVEMKVRAGDEKATLIQDAFSYNVAKEIGALATVLKGDVDAIIITGGLARNPLVIDYIKEMVEFIAPVEVFPGEDELKALAMNGMMAINGEIDI